MTATEEVSDILIAIREKLRAEMGETKGKKRKMDIDDARERESYEAWKVREIARIKKDRFNTAVAMRIRELLESLQCEQPPLKRREVARINKDKEDTEMTLLLLKQLKLPQDGAKGSKAQGEE